MFKAAPYQQQLQETAEWLRQHNLQPDVGVVLGTGLHNLLDQAEVIHTFPYSEIPHFPLSTVESHKGNLVYAVIGNKKVLMMQGRFHFYEGYTMQEVVYPIRVMKLLGVKWLLITNASGGINLDYKKGALAILTDHISLQRSNPLIGQNLDAMGPRFPDMSRPYDPHLNALIQQKAGELSVDLHSGVYAAVDGPNLETRAEYRYLKIIGADMVGMSTVPEVIAANHMQLPCAAVSVVTDECDPEHLQPVDIHEIIAIAARADKKLGGLLKEVIEAL